MSEVRKIRPNLVLTSDVIGGLLENFEEIEVAAVVIKWKDQSISAGWSQMDASMIVFLGEVLKMEGLRVARGE